MGIARYRVSERGQMALPADARRRWDMADGGTVEVADLGTALVMVPAASGGFRGMVRDAVDEAGGYPALVERAVADEPDLT